MNAKKIIGLIGAALAAAGSVILAEKAGKDTFRPTPEPLGEAENTKVEPHEDEDPKTEATEEES